MDQAHIWGNRKIAAKCWALKTEWQKLSNEKLQLLEPRGRGWRAILCQASSGALFVKLTCKQQAVFSWSEKTAYNWELCSHIQLSGRAKIYLWGRVLDTPSGSRFLFQFDRRSPKARNPEPARKSRLCRMLELKKIWTKGCVKMFVNIPKLFWILSDYHIFIYNVCLEIIFQYFVKTLWSLFEVLESWSGVCWFFLRVVFFFFVVFLQMGLEFG